MILPDGRVLFVAVLSSAAGSEETRVAGVTASGQVDPAFLPSTALTVTHDGTETTFEADQIETTDSPIGTLITVQLSVVPDLGTSTLSILLPELAAEPARSELHTIAIRALRKSGIAGPPREGQLSTYTSLHLHGRADEQQVGINAE